MNINVIIDNVFSYSNALDLLMLLNTNKQINKIAEKYKNKCDNFKILGKKVSPLLEAVFNGYLDIVILLHSYSYKLNRDVCNYAAAAGHLKVLQFY